VLTTYFPRCDKANASLVGHFNPVKEIVDLYVSNVLPGVWGNGVEIDPMVDGKPVNPRSPNPCGASGATATSTRSRASSSATPRTSAPSDLRVTRTPESIPGDLSTSRVRIQEDHPSRLFNIEEDGQGNVTAVVLKYEIQRNFGTLTRPDYQAVEVIETITRDEFSQTRRRQGNAHRRAAPQPLRVLPLRHRRHRDNGTQFGDWAYKGSEPVIHAINFRVSQQDRSIGRHMFPKWFLAAAGDKPTTSTSPATRRPTCKLPPDGRRRCCRRSFRKSISRRRSRSSAPR
jgi:hypothetical protein